MVFKFKSDEQRKAVMVKRYHRGTPVWPKERVKGYSKNGFPKSTPVLHENQRNAPTDETASKMTDYVVDAIVEAIKSSLPMGTGNILDFIVGLLKKLNGEDGVSQFLRTMFLSDSFEQFKQEILGDDPYLSQGKQKIIKGLKWFTERVFRLLIEKISKDQSKYSESKNGNIVVEQTIHQIIKSETKYFFIEFYKAGKIPHPKPKRIYEIIEENKQKLEPLAIERPVSIPKTTRHPDKELSSTQLTKNQKKEWLSEHFYYEVKMVSSIFYNGSKMLKAAADANDDGWFRTVVNNMRIESFALHCRCLKEFFYSDNSKFPDDARAFHFYPSKDAWEKIRPAETADLKKLDSRAGKEIAHLTYSRFHGTPPEKQWQMAKIHFELMKVVKVFLDHLPEEYRSERLDEIKKPLDEWLNVYLPMREIIERSDLGYKA